MNKQYSVEVLPCPFTSHIPVTPEITSNLVMHVKGEKRVEKLPVTVILSIAASYFH